jgi:heme-degrading monooxygenase HmoA
VVRVELAERSGFFARAVAQPLSVTRAAAATTGAMRGNRPNTPLGCHASPMRMCRWVICKADVMVLEVANIKVTPGSQDAFVEAFRGARDVLTSTPGCRSVRMTHGVESPSRFVLLVEWDSVQAHEENFRGTDRFTTWRNAIGPFFDGPPHVEHFADV